MNGQCTDDNDYRAKSIAKDMKKHPFHIHLTTPLFRHFGWLYIFNPGSCNYSIYRLYCKIKFFCILTKLKNIKKHCSKAGITAPLLEQIDVKKETYFLFHWEARKQMRAEEIFYMINKTEVIIIRALGH